MEIDRRVRASEVISLFVAEKTTFYKMLKNSQIPKTIRLSEKEVLGYKSTVKKEVEKYKPKNGIVACS